MWGGADLVKLAHLHTLHLDTAAVKDRIDLVRSEILEALWPA